MANIPPTITPAPEGPQRGDRATFAGRVDAFITWMIAAVAQFGALAANAYANAVEAYTQALAAASSAAAAKVAADAAAMTANVTGWVSGTTYAKGLNVWSPINLSTYRRIVAGAGTVDPSLDPTNWASLSSSSAASQTLTDGATVAWNAALGEIATITLGGNRTMSAPTNLKLGSYALHVKQDATGSRTLTLPAIFKFPEDVAPVWSTAAGRCDVVSGVYDGTFIRCSYVRGFTS